MKKTLLTLFFVITSIFSLPALTLAADPCASTSLGAQQAIQCGVNGASGNKQNPAQATTDAQSFITKAVNLISLVAGLLAVVVLIIGGLRLVTSGGSSEKITSARNSILYALIGLVIVALAQIIVKFVLNQTA